MRRSISLVVCVLALAGGALHAQEVDAPDRHRVVLQDGTVLIGVIEQEDDTSVTLRTAAGVQMVIPRTQVVRVELVGRFLRVDPNRTRLLFAPTARPMARREGYVAVYEIFFPFVAVGLTDFLVAAGGISLIPGIRDQVFYLAPRAHLLRSGMVDLSAGLLYAQSTGSSFDDKLGVFYGLVTIGESERAVTMGFGWPYVGREFSDRPVLMIGGELQVGNSLKLLSENWFPLEGDFFPLSLGIRFFGERLAADLAFIYPAGEDLGGGFPFFPWVGFVYNFGR